MDRRAVGSGRPGLPAGPAVRGRGRPATGSARAAPRPPEIGARPWGEAIPFHQRPLAHPRHRTKTMTGTESVVLCLPREACSAIIGSLWATAHGITEPERAELLSTAAQVHVELCRTLGVDPLAARELLFALPR